MKNEEMKHIWEVNIETDFKLIGQRLCTVFIRFQIRCRTSAKTVMKLQAPESAELVTFRFEIKLNIFWFPILKQSKLQHFFLEMFVAIAI
jgi:hypothetical protein